jgi:hypothetical protein
MTESHFRNKNETGLLEMRRTFLEIFLPPGSLYNFFFVDHIKQKNYILNNFAKRLKFHNTYTKCL